MLVTKLIVGRVLQAAVLLVIVSAFIFVSIAVLPGDVAQRVLGREVTEEQLEAFRESLHLDEPVHRRYFTWLAGVVQGDFGTSLIGHTSVSSIVLPRLADTAVLAAFALALYFPITLILASIGAVYRGRPADSTTSLATLIGLSLPDFVLGPILILVFAVWIPFFPVLATLPPEATFYDQAFALALPAITLMVIMSAYAIRMLRASLIDVLESDYVRMATLNGLSKRRVLLRHALPNALGPALNVTALNLTFLIGGIVIVEQIFAYPGIGSLLIESIAFRDVPVVAAIALLGSAFYIFANLIADVLAILLNPRLRAQ